MAHYKFFVIIIIIIQALRDMGFRLVYGRWLIDGYPRVILFDISSAQSQVDDWKREIWKASMIGIPWSDTEANDALVFGFLSAIYIQEFRKALTPQSYIVAHFHEWNSGKNT